MSGTPGTVAEWIAAYLSAAEVAGQSPKTIATRKRSLTVFAQWCAARGITHGGELGTAAALGFQRWLHTHRRPNGASYGLHAQTVFLSDLRAFGAWCARCNWLTDDPAAAVALPKLPRRLPGAVLTVDQIEQLMAQPDVATAMGLRDRAVLELLYAIGATGREIADAYTAHYDRAAAVLRIPPLCKRRPRAVPIGERAAWWLARYLDEARPALATGGARSRERRNREQRSDAALASGADRLFLSQWGGALEPGDVSWLLSKHLRSAGLPPRRGASALRDTVAVHLLEGGADLRFLAALFGHADLQSVRKYAAVSIRALQAVHARFHPAEQAGPTIQSLEHPEP